MENLKECIEKAVERADLETAKDRAAGYTLPRWLLRALAPPHHDLEKQTLTVSREEALRIRTEYSDYIDRVN